MPFAELPTGARLYYDESGAGETVIAIHGMLGTGRTDFPEVIDWLSERYHVIAPTLRGYGESTPKPRDFPNDFYHRDARDVIALMDVLGIKRAHVIGFSDGGEVSLVLAGLAPERILSAASWGSIGYYGPEMRSAMRMLPATWITDEDKALHHLTDADAFARGWTTAVLHMIAAGGDVSVGRAHLATMPVLMMLGDKDRLNPEAYGRRFIERAPDARLVMFDAGHPIHRDQWAQFQQVLGGFLEEASGKQKR
jgi:valacyclovir hydrolase